MKARKNTTLAAVSLGVGALGLSLFSLSMMPQTTVGSGSSLQTGIQGIPTPGTLGGPVAGLTLAQTARWIRGRTIFDRDFHEIDGLGSPNYNGDSCRACHQVPIIGGGGGLELNVSRFGFDNGGAGPFTDLPGGQAVSKFQFPTLISREEYDDTTADVFEQRQTPPLFGLGLIEKITAATIAAGQDPTDADGDGIFGLVRVITIDGVDEAGRFGWKNQVPLLKDFARDAMNGECGITTPADGRGFGISSDTDLAPDPELSITDLSDVVFYMANLAPPPRTNPNDPEVLLGEALFSQVGCAVCHVPSLPDKNGVPVNLYSDLLLHNVMPAGFRGMAETGADVGYYGTPPLWGVRHSKPYFHDGRATTLVDAIQSHDGEAAGVVANYNLLIQSDKDALIRFLEDL